MMLVRMTMMTSTKHDQVVGHRVDLQAPALRESGAAFTLADFLALAMPPLLSAAGDALAEGVEALRSRPSAFRIWDVRCGRIQGSGFVWLKKRAEEGFTEG